MSTVRPARPDDLPALAAVERAAAQRFAGLGLVADLDDAMDPATLAAACAGGRVWVAVDDDGRPLGFAVAERLGDAGHLEELDVLPDAGGRGLGTELLEAVCAWAAAQGLPAVTLCTFRDVAWNAPFYARRGFVALADAELSPALRARRDAEAARGLAPAARVCMRRRLG
ncbi:MAG: GNAT family N-acetyltransferase [bacterium]|nr:GNAT family N-acetyltransferase [bacterium]